jgi:DNA polymerase III epsilon subunit-like protein
MIGSDLLRFSKRKTLLADTETQRLNLLDDNLPFQVAYIVTDKNNVLEKHSYYIKWPNFKMSPDAARITGFQEEWVKNGDDPEEVLEEFESYLYNPEYDIAAQNWLGFDCYVHSLWRRKLGKKPDYSYLDRVYDTNVLSRAYKMGWKPDRDSILAWSYKVQNTPIKGVKTSLGLMAKELGMEVDDNQLHNALYDLEVNNFVHRKIINLIEI